VIWGVNRVGRKEKGIPEGRAPFLFSATGYR